MKTKKKTYVAVEMRDSTKKTSVWKEVGANPLTKSTALGKGRSSSGSSTSSGTEFREFRAGGSGFPSMEPIGVGAHGEEQFLGLGKDRVQLKVSELKGGIGSQDGLESLLRSISARLHLMEIANQPSLSPSEHAVMCFSSCPLKRIDSALRLGQGVVDERDEGEVDMLLCDQLEATAMPIKDMHCEEGGEESRCQLSASLSLPANVADPPEFPKGRERGLDQSN
ncbi:hypothetical protein CMV_007377 [Castanea mollissima]|uniref:Uncharacterized protein n=1 Tax=Castanea mollissima TaxID=60419 RepID=A0A8J4RLY0_9ROSI|nr:hypothetical protein CMV_007377 [Castanea mollissima]